MHVRSSFGRCCPTRKEGVVRVPGSSKVRLVWANGTALHVACEEQTGGIDTLINLRLHPPSP